MIIRKLSPLILSILIVWVWAGTAAMAHHAASAVAYVSFGPTAKEFVGSITHPKSIILRVADTDTPKTQEEIGKEYERQRALLAPKDGDNTRLFVFGGLAVVLVVLVTLIAINRKRWLGPTS